MAYINNLVQWDFIQWHQLNVMKVLHLNSHMTPDEKVLLTEFDLIFVFSKSVISLSIFYVSVTCSTVYIFCNLCIHMF